MAPALLINSVDGSVNIDGYPIAIKKGLSKDVAASALSKFFRTSIDHKNGYEWLAFQGVNFGDFPCGFSLCFYQGALVELHWSVNLPNCKLENGWPTREAIDSEIKYVRNILSKLFSRNFSSGQESFGWGVVWSSFDAKGFQASAGVRYAV
jgi:hypothetical protein